MSRAETTPQQHVVLLSAAGAEQLQQYAERLLRWVEAREGDSAATLERLAYTLQVGREPLRRRWAAVVGSLTELADQLREFPGAERAEATDRSADAAAALARRDLHELARLWSRGSDVDWSQLHRAPYPARLSLPTPPFALRAYWVDEPAASFPARQPLVGTPDGDGEYSATFTGAEFFLRDHAFGEHKILPAVAALELAAATARQAGHGTVVGIDDVMWARPVIVTDEPVQVRLRLAPTERGSRYTVDCGGEVCSAGTLRFGELAAAAEDSLDLGSIQARCPEVCPGSECYALFDRLGGSYGPSFQPLRSVHHGAGEALARVEVPEGLDLAGFELHPTLLDGMLQTALWADGDPAGTEERKLPFALAGLEVRGPLPRRGYVHAVASADTGHDLTLTDDDGRIALRMRGLLTRAVGQAHALRRDEQPVETVACEQTWHPAPHGDPGELAGDVLVISDEPEFAQRLGDQLGNQVVRVRAGDRFESASDLSWTLRLDDDEDWRRLFAALREPAAVVWDAASLPSGAAVVPRLTGLFRGWSQARFRAPVRVFAVHEPTGELDDCYVTALDGLFRTITNEQPNFLGSVLAVPAAGGYARARQVAAELRSVADHEFQVRVSGGVRQVARWTPLDPAGQPGPGISVRAGGTYLVTGGLGALGRIFVRHLGATAGAEFVLTGRSGATPEVREKLAELRALGIDADYWPARLGEPGEAAALVDRIRREHGELRGVLHLAGVTRDSFLLGKTGQDLAAVLGPKVAGTVELDRATAGMRLDFFASFSSLSGVAGTPGQADYAYANRFLDAFTTWREQQRAAGLRSGRSLSLLWPLWADGGIGADMAQPDQERIVARSGLRALPTAAGLTAFDTVGAGDHVLIAHGDPARIGELLDHATHRPLPDRAAAPAAPAVPEQATDVADRAEQYLKDVLAGVFRMPAEEIDAEVAFEAYGIDSLLIMDLTRELEEHFGSLPKTLFFEYQDLRSLTGYFVAHHREALEPLVPAAEAPAPVEPPPPAQVEPPLPARVEVPAVAAAPDRRADEPIAIIGVSARFADADDLDSFWENLRAGRSSIREIPEERWDWRLHSSATEADRAVQHGRWGSFLDGIDEFDPLFFGISPREAEMLDPQERLFLETAWHTIEDAGYTRAGLQPNRTGVYVGAMYALYQLYEADNGRLAASSYASIANRVSYTLGLTGPSLAVDTMCSSALSAIHLAVRDLRSGDTDLAIAGGVNLHVHPYKYRFLAQGQFTSSDGLCRSFGEGGDGYVPGEGVGAVLLKPLARALADGDHVYATILGSSLNHGGRTNGFTVPNPVAQGEVIRRALDAAGVEGRTLSYLEAHGTGTALGDPIEIRGLARAFEDAGRQPGELPIGSVKSNIGHLESAAGMAALCKVLVQLRHRSLVPSLHSEALNPNIDWSGTPLRVQQELAEWHRPAPEVPRRAGISSFGAGGSNAHLVVEEHQPVAPRPSTGVQLVPLSAKTGERLQVLAARLADFLDRHPDTDLAAAAHTLQTGREAHEERAAVVVSSTAELAARCRDVADGRTGEVQRGSLRAAGRDRQERARLAKQVQHAAQQRDLAAVAELWVRGAEPDWALLHDGNPGRTPLPGYPFERFRCWITDQRPVPGGPAVAAHPLLAQVEPAESLDGLAFGKVFTAHDPLLRDHRIGPVQPLPGVAVLEMARAASAAAGLTGPVALRNVRWLRPLVVEQGERRALLRLRRAADGLGFELASADGDVHAQGLVTSLEAARDEVEPPARIEARCPQRYAGEQLYADFESFGVGYGPALRAVEQIAYGRDEALARISVPVDDGGLGECVLHPALLDGALHALAALRDRASGQPMVPYAVEAVEVWREPARRGHAHVRPVGQDRYDISLLDDDGELCVRLRDLALRPVSTEDDVETGADLSELLYVPEWTPLGAAPPPQPVDSAWIVRGEGTDALAAELSAAVTGQPLVVDPTEVETLTGRPLPAAVYFLADRAPSRHDDAELLETNQQRGVLALFRLVKLLLVAGAATRPLRVVVITEGVCAVDGHRVENPFAGSLHGLAQTLAQEFRRWQVAVVDRAGGPGAPALPGLVEQALAAGADSPLAVRGGVAHRRKLVPRRPSTADGRIRRGGTYLVLGGAGGIGLELAEWLVHRYQARVVLVGRSALSAEKRQRLAEVDPSGELVDYQRADAGDPAALRAVVRGVEDRCGALHGVFHSTIVLRDQSLLTMEESAFRAALDAKTKVSVALLAAVGATPLDFVLFFSSAVSLSGNAGQSNYAAGGAFEDAFGHFLGSHLGAAVRVINWGYWGTVGVAADERTRERFAQHGVFSILPHEGMAAVAHVLAHDDPQVLVTKASREVLEAAGVDFGPAPQVAAEPEPGPESDADLDAAVTAYVRRAFHEVLQVPPDRLWLDETFENFGIDSLTMPQLVDVLAADLGPLPATLLFEHRTLRDLVAHLVGEHADALRELLLPDARRAVEAPRVEVVASEPASSVPDRWRKIAIVGVAGRYPDAADLDEFWQNLRQGRDCVREVPADRWDWREWSEVDGRAISRWGGFLDGIAEFDPRFFQMSLREAELLDPQERLFLQTAWHALEDAGYPRGRLRGSRVGVYVGVMYGHYQLLETEDGLAGGMGYASIANRVSYAFDFQGPSLAVDTMCSSSLTALHLACEALMLGDADYALAGGVNLAVHPRKYAQLAAGGFTSSDGRCRSFGADGDGMVPGEGVGAVLLKPLELAERDGDRIHGVILGSAANHGGKTGGYTVPNPVAQGELIGQALRRAEVEPSTVSYVEAHGTGTALGDPTEVAGLARAFGERPGRIAIGSVKSGIGHLESAAGIAAVTKVLLQMRHGELAPSLHADRLNPGIDWEDVPFTVQRELAPWRGEPLRAAVSSFGAGGSNAHLVLEQYPEPAAPAGRDGARLFVFSARDRDRLRELVGEVLGFLRGTAGSSDAGTAAAELARRAGLAEADLDEPLAELGVDLTTMLQLAAATDVRPGTLHEGMSLRELAGALAGPAGGSELDLDRLAFTLQVGREAMGERLAVVASDVAELRAALTGFTGGQGPTADVCTGTVRAESWLRPRPVTSAIHRAADRAELRRLAERWVGGEDVDWESLYPVRPRVISAPGYPFAREHCWISAQPSARQPRATTSARPVASRGALHDRILAVLSSLTGYPAGELATDTSFHEHGLDSLGLIRFAERLGQELGRELSPDLFLAAPTVDELADRLAPEHPAAGAPEVATTGSDPVVVVGMAGTLPGSPDLESFWTNLRRGGDLLSEVPADRWDWRERYGDPAEHTDRTRVNRGGFMPAVDRFDPLFFGISRREARWMDPQQRLLLQTAWSAIEDAGIDPVSLAGTRTGVFVGVGPAEYGELIQRSGVRADAYASTGLTPSILANRISYQLDLRGPSEPVDTACSSSLVALHRAAEAIELGHCDAALAAGVSVMLSPVTFASLELAGMISPDGVGRAFDQEANGYVRGEGVGAVLLKRLSQAVADGDPIHAVLRGTAVNHGGRANSLTAPNPDAQAEVVIRAHERAGLDPATIGYLETHGTGTTIGDPAEITGLRQAFAELYERWGHEAPAQPHCALAALKNVIGHLEPAAGIAAVLRVLLSMRHGQLTGTPNIQQLNRFLNLSGSPFHIPLEGVEWHRPRGADGAELPRRAGVSAFGYGGVNAHVVLEEYRADSAPTPQGPVVFTLSARDPERLREYARRFVEATGWTEDLAGTAFTLQVGRTDFPARLAFVASTGEQAKDVLSRYLAGTASEVHTGSVERGSAPKVGADEDDLDAVAAAWVRGASIDWRRLHRGAPRRRSLPTYPFAPERHWFSTDPEPTAPVGDLTWFRTGWQQAAVPAGTTAGQALVFAAAPATPADVLVRPAERYREVDERCFEIRPDAPEDYLRVLTSLRQRGIGVRRVAHLWSLDAPAEHRLTHGPESFFLLLRAFGSNGFGDLERIQVAVPESDAALAEAWGGFAGSVKAMAPGVGYSVIRFSQPDRSALLAELAAEPDAAVVRYHDGVRFVQRQQEFTPAETGAEPVFRDQGTYLITGGAGGLGRMLARELARDHRARLALLGRSELDEDGQALLAELRALGGEAEYFPCDVADTAQLAAVVDQVKARWGRLHGVFHLAGTVSAVPLPDKDLAEFRAQLRPRIDGTRALDAATAAEPLDLFVLYASTSGHLGDYGLADYGVGARYLDGFAAEREAHRAAGRRHGRTVAIDWPMWRDGGMHLDPEDERRYLATTGFRYLESDEGRQMLEDAVRSGLSQVMVVAGDPERVRALVHDRPARRTAPAPDPAPAPEPAPATAPEPAVGVEAAVAAELRRMIRALLEITDAELDDDAGFGEFGLDSFGLKSLGVELADRYGIEVPTIAMFGANTVTKLTAHLVREFPEELRRAHPVVAEHAAEPAPEPAVAVDRAAAPGAPEPIAVIGMSGRFPGAADLDEFWANLVQERDLITEAPAERWDWRELDRRFPGTPRWGGFLSDVDRFDSLFFRISPLEAQVVDPQHRLFLEETWKALEDAGIRADRLAGRAVAVFAGTQFTDYEAMVSGSAEPNAYAGAGLARTMLANRISYLLDLRGPSESIDTACSSSLVAVHRAVRSLRSGESELAIAGGVSLVLSPHTVISAHQLGMLSPDGRCKPLDSSANGYVKGEGVAALVLKPLSRALADGDRVHAVIRGSAQNHGGHASSLTAPNPDAQEDLLVAAYRDADVPVESVSYVELHGTGTELGDPIEIDALQRAHRRLANGQATPVECGVGSIKSNIGHLEPAAGIAGVLKVVLAMRHGQLPATLHLAELNPHIRLDAGPFTPVRRTRDWRPVDGSGAPLPRRAGVSSFGFGGVNAHVVLEEPPAVPEPEPEPGPRVFVLSAKNTERLRQYAADVVDLLDTDETDDLASLAHTSQVGRVPMDARLAVVAASRAELRAALAAYLAADSAANLHVGEAGRDHNGWLTEPEGQEYLRRIQREGDLDRLAQLWVGGARIDWAALHQGPLPRRATLPTYPFADQRHWLRTGNTPQPAARDDQELLLAKVWRPVAEPPAVVPPAASVLVLTSPENEGLARDLFGPEAAVAVLTEAEDADPETGRRLAGLAGAARTVVDLVDVAAQPTDRAAESWARIVLAQELVARLRTSGLHYLHFTHGLTPFGADRPTLRGAAFAGLVSVLGAEYPGVLASTVDVDAAELTAERLRLVVGRELGAVEQAGEVCLRGGTRHLPELAEVEAPAGDVAWCGELGGRTVVITGGTGAIGRSIAAELIDRGADRLVLLGHRELPDRARWPEICAAEDADPELVARLRGLLELERPGVRLRVVSTSLTDPAALRRVLAEAREELGPITGVVHCAGLGLLTNPAFVGKQVAEVRAVLEPKVAGLQELAAACADDPLRFFVLCSSVSGAVPALGAGLSDYALANSFLDRFAAHQAARGRTYFRSLQWPSWQSMGMPAVTTPVYRDLGLRTLPDSTGMGLLHRAMSVPDRPVLMPALVDPEAFDRSRLLRLADRVAPRQQRAEAPAVADPVVAAGPAVLERLTAVFAEQLRLDAQDLGPDTGFADLGVDSIMIAQLVSAVERALEITVEPSAFLEHPTLRRLAAHLQDEVPAAAAPAAAAPAGGATTAPAAGGGSTATGPTGSGKVAVIGLACHFPGAANAAEFWRNLAGGVDSVTEVPASRWDVREHYASSYQPGRSISKWGGFLPGIEEFDPGYFGISARQARQVDPLMRQFLEVSAECLHDAGYRREEVAGTRVGVYAGSRVSNFGSHLAAVDRDSISGQAQNFIAAQVAHFLDVRGPVLVVDSACSSSLVSVHLAAQALRAGECDMALAGGVEVLLDQIPFVGMSEARALSPTGRCHTFDERADGIVLGEGAGVVLLKRYEDALRDGDRVAAVIEGGAVNNDGRTMGITTPNPDAQREVIEQALRAAGVRADGIGYVEAHGTGTMIGDPMELKALTQVLRAGTDETGFCGVGSVKTNIGHLLSAAGIAGLIKVVLSLREGALPPTLHCETTNPRFRFEDSPLFPVRELQPWRPRGGVRRAGISSFGFGGTNAHLVVAEAVPPAGHQPRRAPLEPVRFERERYWFERPEPPRAEVARNGAEPFFELRF